MRAVCVHQIERDAASKGATLKYTKKEKLFIKAKGCKCAKFVNGSIFKSVPFVGICRDVENIISYCHISNKAIERAEIYCYCHRIRVVVDVAFFNRCVLNNSALGCLFAGAYLCKREIRMQRKVFVFISFHIYLALGHLPSLQPFYNI